MKQLISLKAKRDKLCAQLLQCNDAIAGNLSKASSSTSKKGIYWRITWKENQKTKIQYVRKEDVAAIAKGIKQFTQLKKIVLHIGEINRSIALLRNSSE